LTAASLVCNGNTALTGIGRAKAEQIWYVAATEYFTSGTGYADAASATLNAAADLYGAGSAEFNAVLAAWAAVDVEPIL
jgi:Zn-dependent metalloprotease